MIRSGVFRIEDLEVVGSPEDYQDVRDKPLGIGSLVQLNSGGPRLLVVDLDTEGRLTAAWRDASGGEQEISLPAVCFHRISPV